ncbi:unnamed protein product [Paramecium sonneborni]|uniref:Uncharacterized protein n=1 Tax=Paramecium sonneborni TaxID=65129 RepID=A0A8S1NE68_9CILI|nr:unnamed protein product [Paramecium sonneborni]
MHYCVFKKAKNLSYSNLILKSKSLECSKVMDILKESFHHTQSIKNMEAILVVSGTGVSYCDNYII